MMKIMFLSGPVYKFVLTVNPEKRDPSDVGKVQVVPVGREQQLLLWWSIMSGTRKVFYLTTLTIARSRFSAVQTGPGAHPASCTIGTGSFPGVESGGGVTLTPHPLLVPRYKIRVELYLYSP